MAIQTGVVFGDTLEVLFTTEGEVFDNSNLSSELPLLKIHQEGSGVVTSDLSYLAVELSWKEYKSGERMRLVGHGQDVSFAYPGDTGTFATYKMVFWDQLVESL